MTRMIRINGDEYHAVPSRECKSHSVHCWFTNDDCSTRTRLCSTSNGARTIDGELCYVVPNTEGCYAYDLRCKLLSEQSRSHCQRHSCDRADNNGVEVVYLTQKNYVRYIAAKLTT